MSYKLVQSAVELDGLKPIEKLTLVCLAHYSNDVTGECWPSQTTLARRVGASRQTVNSAVKSLERKGIITMTFSSERKTPNYHINLTRPVKNPDTTPVKNPDTYLSKNLTQTRKMNREGKNKEFNKEASDSYIPTEEDSYKPTTEENLSVCANQHSCCLVDSFDWDEISKAAARLLVTEGFSEAEAYARVKAELEEAKWSARQRSKDGWKNLDGATIKHPQKHTIGTLANLARKTKSLPPITRDELEEVLDGNPQLAECLFCGEVTDDFWAFLVCKNFRNSQGETISRWNVQNTIRWYSEFRDDLVSRGHLRLRLGA